MNVSIAYRIVEHYDNEPPEPFGFESFPADKQPNVGDVVMLHWLDGREAYRVRVDRVSDMTLHVTAALAQADEAVKS